MSMFDSHRFTGPQDNSGDCVGDGHCSPSHSRTQSSLTAVSTGGSSEGGGNVDRVLFNNLMEMVPLLESFIERKASSSFTRRASMAYTKKPAIGTSTKKIIEQKGKNGIQSTSRSFALEDREEIASLRKQLEDIQRKLVERDELLKSREYTKNQLTENFDELEHQAAEKDSLMKSSQLKLYDSKIKLADKQAALEKLQWEVQTSNRKVETLQENLDSVRGELSSLMLLFEGLPNSCSSVYSEAFDINPNKVDYLPEIDDLNEMERQQIEKARDAYVVAIAEAKEKQDEKSIAVAASARLHLQSCLFKTGMRSLQ